VVYTGLENDSYVGACGSVHTVIDWHVLVLWAPPRT